MTLETPSGARNNFDRYISVDNESRWKNDLSWIVISIVLTYLLHFGFDLSEKLALVGGATILVVGMTASTILSCMRYSREIEKPIPIEPIKQIEPIGRGFISQLVYLSIGAVVVLLLGVFLPSAEASIIEDRLKRTLSSGYTHENIQKAAKIVSNAQRDKLHANPALISRIGDQILKTDDAVGAAATFASYRSTLTQSPLVQSPVLPAIVIVPSLGLEMAFSMIRTTSPNANDGVIYDIPGGRNLEFAPNVSRVIARVIHEPIYSLLDGSYLRNITMIDGDLGYRGGILKLESIEFINCHFVIFQTDKGNDNIRRLLEAVLKGGYITLDLK
jgi:hypothetical protein